MDLLQSSFHFELPQENILLYTPFIIQTLSDLNSLEISECNLTEIPLEIGKFPFFFLSLLKTFTKKGNNKSINNRAT